MLVRQDQEQVLLALGQRRDEHCLRERPYLEKGFTMKMNPLIIVQHYGRDILELSGMEMSKGFMQHGDTSVFAHSLAVALICVQITYFLPKFLSNLYRFYYEKNLFLVKYPLDDMLSIMYNEVQ